MLDINDLFPNGLSIEDAIDLLRPVTLYVIGVAVYAAFVFNFYRFVALRDMFAFDIYRFEESNHPALRSFLHVIAYVLKYLIVFPLFAFFWFAVLVLMLTFLAKDRDFTDTLLIALAMVSGIRFSAYYDEDLARDLAKILPFALLALFLIDASFFDIVESLETLTEVSDHGETVVYYLLFLIGLEFVLRFGFGLHAWLFKKRPARTKPPVSEPTVEEVEASPTEGDEVLADSATVRESSG